VAVLWAPGHGTPDHRERGIVALRTDGSQDAAQEGSERVDIGARTGRLSSAHLGGHVHVVPIVHANRRSRPDQVREHGRPVRPYQHTSGVKRSMGETRRVR